MTVHYISPGCITNWYHTGVCSPFNSYTTPSKAPCGCASCGCDCPGGGEASQKPVRYNDGQLQYVARDLAAGGFGSPLLKTRVYNNRLSHSLDAG